jgi:RNA polymerase sigma-70 factor (ECF subfamily)
MVKPVSPEPRSKASAGAVPDAPQDLDEEERALIGRAQAQDQEAFRLLVERYRDRAYGLALRIVRAAPDAEEVAQNAFVRAWLALPRFRGEARFSTWLYRIVARQAFDRLVMLRRRRERETGIEAASGRAGPEASTGAGEAWVLAHRLERLVGKLSDGQRAAVTLFYYEGRSVEQVAETLGMPTGTVKTHLSRARAALRKAWLAHDRAATR